MSSWEPGAPLTTLLVNKHEHSDLVKTSIYWVRPSLSWPANQAQRKSLISQKCYQVKLLRPWCRSKSSEKGWYWTLPGNPWSNLEERISWASHVLKAIVRITRGFWSGLWSPCWCHRPCLPLVLVSSLRTSQSHTQHGGRTCACSRRRAPLYSISYHSLVFVCHIFANLDPRCHYGYRYRCHSVRIQCHCLDRHPLASRVPSHLLFALA